MILTPTPGQEGTGSDKTEEFLGNKKKELHIYLSGEYFLDKLGIDEIQMKNKIKEINGIEDEIIKTDRTKLEEILGTKEVDDIGRKEFESFQKALIAGKIEIEKRMEENTLTKLIEGHKLELFSEKNNKEQFSLVSLVNRFLFTRLIEIKEELKKKLGNEYKDDYLLLRKHKITLGKIGPKALNFLLGHKLSTENIIRTFWKFKEKSKLKFGEISYGFIERSMIRVWKEELDERVVDKIRITEVFDEKIKETLKKTYLYKVLFPHFCNHAPGSFQNSLGGKPEDSQETNKKNPTGFFIKNESGSQLFYFKIDQGKKSALNIKTTELGGINDFDNLLMREISQTIKETLGEKNQFNYSELSNEEIINIQEQFKDYCKIERIGGCMIITILKRDINFEQTDKKQSDRLLEPERAKNEQEKIELLQKDFEKAKEIAEKLNII